MLVKKMAKTVTNANRLQHRRNQLNLGFIDASICSEQQTSFSISGPIYQFCMYLLQSFLLPILHKEINNACGCASLLTEK